MVLAEELRGLWVWQCWFARKVRSREGRPRPFVFTRSLGAAAHPPDRRGFCFLAAPEGPAGPDFRAPGTRGWDHQDPFSASREPRTTKRVSPMAP